jgi:tetrahydromethanopterin S-methyltransferase subunit G
MEKEPQEITTIPQLAAVVVGLASTVNSLTTKVDGLATTINDLAAMTARGFSEVHTRIDGIETSLSTRIDGLDQKIGSVHHAVLMLSFDYNKIKARLENLELKAFGSIQEA